MDLGLIVFQCSPTQAMPRKEANNRIAFTLAPDKKPLMVKEEMTISATSTIRPMKAERPCSKRPETLKAKSRMDSSTRKAMRLVTSRNDGAAATTIR